MSQIDDAVASLKKYPTAVGYKGVFPTWMLQRMDPKGNAARIRIGKLTSAEIKDTSGTAVSGAEFERIRPWIPNSTDTADTAMEKLKNLREIIAKYNTGILSYADTQGYRRPGVADPGVEVPVGLELPPGARYIGPAP